MQQTPKKRVRRSSLVQIAIASVAMSPLLLSAETQAQTWTERQVSGGGTLSDDFPDSTWLCGLSGVRGSFEDHDMDGGNQYVAVFHLSGEWQLQAGSGRTGRMICTRLSNFTRPAGSVTWYSDGFVLESWNRNADFSKTKDLWWGDAASMISHMAGEFEGTHEYLQITQSTDASAPSQFKIASHAGDTFSSTDMYAVAHSVFLGNPNNHVRVRLIGYNTGGAKTRCTAACSGTFEMAVSSESGFSAYWLADTTGPNGGFCYFTRLSGDFNGGGESAIITELSNMWRLDAVAGGGEVYAKARCMAYDQR